jgi:hypothetical protein
LTAAPAWMKAGARAARPCCPPARPRWHGAWARARRPPCVHGWMSPPGVLDPRSCVPDPGGATYSGRRPAPRVARLAGVCAPRAAVAREGSGPTLGALPLIGPSAANVMLRLPVSIAGIARRRARGAAQRPPVARSVARSPWGQSLGRVLPTALMGTPLPPREGALERERSFLRPSGARRGAASAQEQTKDSSVAGRARHVSSVPAIRERR